MASWLLTVPTDTPFLPADLVGHLASPLASGRATAAFAASAGVFHPIVALWARAALFALMQRISAGDVRRLQTLLPAIGGIPVMFPADGGDPFFNVNTPADLATAAARLAAPTASPGSG